MLTTKSEQAHLHNLARAELVYASARTVLPIVFDLIRPSSVVDVGCSAGFWLQVCRELGATTICGIDGSYVDSAALCIPADCFIAHDLNLPIRLERKFDLAINLEVAEHLPAASAALLIDSLVRLAPVVLFSAAIPFQGGVGHVNEQWPEYWAALFNARGFVPVDCIRLRIWDLPGVEEHYAQNALLYVEREHLRRHERLSRGWEANRDVPLALVHPRHYLDVADPARMDLSDLTSSQVASAIRIFLKRKSRAVLHWRLQRLLFGK